MTCGKLTVRADERTGVSRMSCRTPYRAPPGPAGPLSNCNLACVNRQKQATCQSRAISAPYPAWMDPHGESHPHTVVVFTQHTHEKGGAALSRTRTSVRLVPVSSYSTLPGLNTTQYSGSDEPFFLRQDRTTTLGCFMECLVSQTSIRLVLQAIRWIPPCQVPPAKPKDRSLRTLRRRKRTLGAML